MTRSSSGAQFLLSTLGWLVSVALGWLAVIIVAALLFGVFADAFFAALAGGFVLAAGTWLVVRRWLTDVRPAAWIAATAFGMLAGMIVVEILGGGAARGTRQGFDLVAVWAVGGAVAGLVQSLALGRQLRGVGWWTPITAVAWGILVALTRGVLGGDGNFVLGALAYGLVTWAGLLLLLSRDA